MICDLLLTGVRCTKTSTALSAWHASPRGILRLTAATPITGVAAAIVILVTVDAQIRARNRAATLITEGAAALVILVTADVQMIARDPVLGDSIL